MNRVLRFILVSINMYAAAGSGFLPPNESLVIDGVPPIPLSLVEDCKRYADFRAAEFQSWNSDQRQILIRTRFGNSLQVHLVREPFGARTQLTFLDEPVGWALSPPTKSNYFIFSSDNGGGEFYQHYRFDLDTRTITLLTDGAKRNGTGEWSDDGRTFAYTRVDATDKGAFTQIHLVDPLNPTTHRALGVMDGGGWTVADWSPDGSYLLLRETISINESYMWLYDLKQNSLSQFAPERRDERISFGPALFGKDGKGIYTATDRDSEFRQLTFIDMNTREHIALTREIPWDVTSFDITKDGRHIAFAANEDGTSRVYLLNTLTRKHKPVPNLPDGVVDGIKWRDTDKEFAFTLSTAQSPADVFTFDVRRERLERWTQSETGMADAASFPNARRIAWDSFDGKQITGLFYPPPTRFTGERPVMIVIHGGPEGQSIADFKGRLNYFLNELGIALLFPNVRGSSGYGKTFLQLDNGLLRDHSYKDIGALFDWIATQPDLDSNRVMVTGTSYGGFMTLAVAANYNDKIACSIDVVGISNLRTFLENTQGYRRDLRRAEYGDERDPKVRDYLESIAPLNKAANITKPIFVIQGKNDPRVPISESDQMVRTLKANGTDVWYLVANDEGHGFRKKSNVDFQFYATTLFVRKYLLEGNVEH